MEIKIQRAYPDTADAYRQGRVARQDLEEQHIQFLNNEMILLCRVYYTGIFFCLYHIAWMKSCLIFLIQLHTLL